MNLSALLVALKRPFTGSLLITRFFFGVAFATFQTVFSLYTLTRFGLSAAQTGYILAYVGVLSVVTQGFLVGWMSKRVREDILIVVCVALMAASLLGWALASSVVALLAIMLPTAFSGGLLNTLLSSTLTRTVDPKETGGILGLSASIESATRIVAPVAGGMFLQQLGTWAPGAFGAILMAGLLVYVWIALYDHEVVHALQQEKVVVNAAPVE